MRIENAIHWKLQAEPMPSDRIEQDLERRAYDRITEGRLPCPSRHRTWGGRGSNVPCALCDVTIRSDEVEYEIETRHASGVQLYRFHFLCHDAWRYACVAARPAHIEQERGDQRAGTVCRRTAASERAFND